MHEGRLFRDAEARVPLATINRHGRAAGATGTGKTKTLQGMTEQLSAAGVPVSDFGPQLPAKVLAANETQESSLGLVFHYADTNSARGSAGCRTTPAARPRRRATAPKQSTPDSIGDFLGSRQGRRLRREVVRGVLGLLRKRLQLLLRPASRPASCSARLARPDDRELPDVGEVHAVVLEEDVARVAVVELRRHVGAGADRGVLRDALDHPPVGEDDAEPDAGHTRVVPDLARHHEEVVDVVGDGPLLPTSVRVDDGGVAPQRRNAR